MRAVSYTRFGEPDVLSVGELPDPTAGPGQVRVRVETAGINPIDWKIVSGAMSDDEQPAGPTVPGLDVAGVVDEVGEGATGVNIGDAVFGQAMGGSAAEFAVLREWVVKPAGLGWDVAGSLNVAAETAVRVLDLLDLVSGQTVLIDGAAGGVGLIASQVAASRGVQVIGTASESNHEFLQSVGIVPVTYGSGLAGRIRAVAADGVHAAIDTSGRGSLPDLVAIAGDPRQVVTIADFGVNDLGVQVSTGGGSRTPRLALVAELVVGGQLQVPIAGIYPWDRIGEAYRRSMAGHVRGKLVLVPTQS